MKVASCCARVIFCFTFEALFGIIMVCGSEESAYHGLAEGFKEFRHGMMLCHCEVRGWYGHLTQLRGCVRPHAAAVCPGHFMSAI